MIGYAGDARTELGRCERLLEDCSRTEAMGKVEKSMESQGTRTLGCWKSISKARTEETKRREKKPYDSNNRIIDLSQEK
jgi:hypothetical protein